MFFFLKGAYLFISKLEFVYREERDQEIFYPIVLCPDGQNG